MADELEQANIHPHPPWKRLYAALKGRLSYGDLLSYPHIAALMGIDARTTGGRQQFLRCKKEFLINHNLHFENEPRVGYRVVCPPEHLRCGNGQIKKARRRVRQGIAITVHVDYEQLTIDQRRLQTDAIGRMSRLEETMTEVVCEVRKLAVASTKIERLPPGLDQGKKGDGEGEK